MLRDTFTVHQGRETNWCICKAFVHVTGAAYSNAFPQFTARYGEANSREAMLIWSVDRLASELRSANLGDGNPIRINLDTEHFDQLERILEEKRCSYQVRDGRDVFCSAAADTLRFGKLRSVGLRTLAPTSSYECRQCGLPDQRYLCSQLSHPEIAGGEVADFRRYPMAARCGRNREEVNTPSLCHAGGNGCWEYLVLPWEEDTPPAYVSPALTRALDFLDATWRLRFGKSKALVHLTSAASVAALERECTNEQDFDDRVIALGDVLRALTVPDALTQPSEEGSLNRLEAALKKQIADEAHRDRAVGAVATLRAANSLRVGAAHGASDARARRLKAETSLGIQFYPDVTWRETWNQLRARVTDALSEIASVLKGP